MSGGTGRSAIVTATRLLFSVARPWVVVTFAVQLALGALPALELGLLGRAAELLVAHRSPVGTAIALAGAVAVRHLLEHALTALNPNVSVTPLLLRDVFHRVAAAEPGRFDDPTFLDLIQRAGGGVASQGTVMLFTAGEALRALAGTCGMVGLLSRLDLRLALLATVSAVPVLIIARIDGADAASLWTGDTFDARLRGYLGQLLRDPAAASELRALSLAPHLLTRLAHLFRERVNALRALARRSRNRSVVVAIAQGGATVVALAVLVGDVVRGTRTAADVVIGIGAVGALSRLLERLASEVGYVTTAAPYLEPAEQLHRLEPDEPLVERPARHGVAPLDLVLDEVTFAYRNAPVLDGLDLSIEPGEVVAIVGENGAGKSTLVRVALGVLTPQSGRVSLGGVDIDARAAKAMWPRVGYLPQFPLRPEVSLREAVALGRPWEPPDDARVAASLRAVGADGLVAELGLDAMLGRAWEQGHDLSGGQWQRIALARLVYRAADLWILDEPTSSFDPHAEAAFVEGLRSLTSGATCIFISHRFSTVRAADRIAVLDRGAIVELGSHDELIERSGIYAELFEVQAAGYR